MSEIARLRRSLPESDPENRAAISIRSARPPIITVIGASPVLIRRTARAEGGATWADFDHETQAFGLASAGGIASTTGLAGLTLGGGIGYLNRKYGLACDNLISADVVTADGQLLTASLTENSDLFWALRDGGGNFGVVTSFEYKIHRVGPVLAGFVLCPLDRAKAVLRFYREFLPAAPDELRLDAILGTSPIGPSVAIIACWCGQIEERERVRWLHRSVP
jgi:hypothetical protein